MRFSPFDRDQVINQAGSGSGRDASQVAPQRLALLVVADLVERGVPEGEVPPRLLARTGDGVCPGQRLVPEPDVERAQVVGLGQGEARRTPGTRGTAGQ